MKRPFLLLVAHAAVASLSIPREGWADGPRIAVEAPAPLAKRACSFQTPICVNAGNDVSEQAILRTLETLEELFPAERAWFELPTIPVDEWTGNVEVRLVHGRTPPRVLLRRRSMLDGFDRASGLIETGDAILSTCAGRELLAASLVRLMTLATNPAMDETSAQAIARTYAAVFQPCGRELEVEARQPRALMPSPFLRWLDERWSDGRRRIPFSFLALSPTKSAFDASTWSNEPDFVDIAKESSRGLYGGNTGLGDALLHFYADARADGSVQAAWSIPFPMTPRRLFGEPLAPGGGGIVAIEGGAFAPSLRVEVEWESPADMFVAALVTGKDRSVRFVSIGGTPRATRAQGSIRDVGDAVRIDVLTVHAGEWFTPFDPDLELTQRGYAVSVVAE